MRKAKLSKILDFAALIADLFLVLEQWRRMKKYVNLLAIEAYIKQHDFDSSVYACFSLLSSHPTFCSSLPSLPCFAHQYVFSLSKSLPRHFIIHVINSEWRHYYYLGKRIMLSRVTWPVTLEDPHDAPSTMMTELKEHSSSNPSPFYLRQTFFPKL